MAKVSLIVYTNELNVIGVRSLSAFLKSKGHNAQIIYLLLPYQKCYDFFSDRLYRQVIQSCMDSDLIGFSLTSNFHLEAVKATKMIKELNKPIIWGGIHPTLFPEGCMKEVDLIARGESEEALFELTEAISQRKDYSNIKNLWVRTREKGIETIKRNPLRPFIQDLDKIPFCDSDFESHLVSDKDYLKPITTDLMKKYMTSGDMESRRIDYYLSTSRGCPYHCTYCCNNGLQKLYGGVHIRTRSAENVIKEIEEVIKKYPFINYIFLTDEEFFVQSVNFMKEFSALYKLRIGLPLKIEFAPSLFNEEKFKMLLEAGVVECHMGVQSGCDDTNKNMYERNIEIRKIYKILETIKPYQKYLRKFYIHLIVFNEMECETSTKKTLEFVYNIDRFFDITFFPIVYFPGTSLYEKARQSKLIEEDNYIFYLSHTAWDQLKEIKKADYYTVCFLFIYWFKKFNLPMWIYKIMIKIFYIFFTNKFISSISKHKILTKFMIKLYITLRKLYLRSFKFAEIIKRTFRVRR